MYLSSLILQDFRNSAKRSLAFDEETNLIFGPNGSGKTNIMEAMFLLATGKSFRAQRIEEMISYDKELARVSGMIGMKSDDDRTSTALELVLTRGELGGKRVAKRRYSVDGVSKRAIDFVGRVAVVLFRPEDLEIILGSPQVRRVFLDDALSQVDREYHRSLVSYEKALTRRNRILDLIREGRASRTQLLFWDGLLIKHGQILNRKRLDFLEFVDRFQIGVDSYTVRYQESVISEKRLKSYAEQEIAIGYTLVGPHKDDLSVEYDNGKPLVSYGSRGEQRLAVLWLKLAELAFVTQRLGEKPILLLDDILSELDHRHREQVISIIPNQQALITTTEPALIESKYRGSMRMISLEQERGEP